MDYGFKFPASGSFPARCVVLLRFLETVNKDPSIIRSRSYPHTYLRAIGNRRGLWLAVLLTVPQLLTIVTPLRKNSVTHNFTVTIMLILITGSSSGVGFEGAVRLAKLGHTLVLPCRTQRRALDTVERIQNRLKPIEDKACFCPVQSPIQKGDTNDAETIISGKLIPAECDLASLESVRSFAKGLPSLVGGAKLDVVCHNAVIARSIFAKEPERTVDGFESVVGTNYVGTFYLNHLILPLVSPTGKICVTGSQAHDPSTTAGGNGKNSASLGDLAGLKSGKDFEMVDGGKYLSIKTYRDSKVRKGLAMVCF